MTNKEESILVANTDQFRLLEIDSRGRNRGPSHLLMKKLDPCGMHVLSQHFLHGEEELRGVWMCKVKSDIEPVICVMDNCIGKISTLTTTYSGAENER